MRKYLQLVFLAVSVFCSEILLAESRDPVRILDLRTLNELDLKEQEEGGATMGHYAYDSYLARHCESE